MNEAFTLTLAWMAGGALGTLFFGGLWWTVRQGVSSSCPALWFLGSLLLRMSIALIGFYIIGHDQWQRLLWCLLGFVMARYVVMWLTRTSRKRSGISEEVGHAP